MAERRARQKRSSVDEARVAFGDWTIIKRPIQRLYTLLINTPAHVIITAREKDLYDDNSDQPKVIGAAPDIEKNAPYVFDLVLRLTVENGKRFGTVEKSRFAEFPPGTRIENPTWATFEVLATTGEQRSAAPDIDAAAEREAAPGPAAWTRDKDRVKAAEKFLADNGLADADANAALEIDDWRQTHLDPKAFKETLDAWIEGMVKRAPSAASQRPE